MKVLTDSGLTTFWNKIKSYVSGSIFNPDDEDISSSKNSSGAKILKLADREYNASNFSGKGYKILRKNIKTVNNVKKNVLEQSMINTANTIYEIRYDFDLNGATIEIPEGCTLAFEGGSLANGTVTLNKTYIKSKSINVFNNISPQGSFGNDSIIADVFKLAADGDTDDSGLLQKILDVAKNSSPITIKFAKSNYFIKYPIFILGKDIVLDGENKTTFIATQNGSGRGGIVIGQSYEINKSTTDTSRDKGVYGSTNTSYKDPELCAEIDKIFYKGSSKNEAEGCCVKNICVKFDYTKKGSWSWGGYAFNIYNSYDCHILNCSSYGATQCISMGSDVAPSTPGNNYCSAENCVAHEPSIWTYYSIGLISNSYNSWIENCISYDTIPVYSSTESKDGNSLALAYCTNCKASGISIRNGKNGANAESVLLNSCNNCVLENIDVTDAKCGLAVFPFNYNHHSGNIIRNIKINNCDEGLRIAGKHDIFDRVIFYGCTKDLVFTNTNAQFNLVSSNAQNVANPFSSAKELLNNYNYVIGKIQRKSILINLSSYATNSNSVTQYEKTTGKDTEQVFTIPLRIKNIDAIKTNITFPLDNGDTKANVTFTLSRYKKRVTGIVGSDSFVSFKASYDDPKKSEDIDQAVNFVVSDAKDFGEYEFEYMLNIKLTNCLPYTRITQLVIDYIDL